MSSLDTTDLSACLKDIATEAKYFGICDLLRSEDLHRLLMTLRTRLGLDHELMEAWLHDDKKREELRKYIHETRNDIILLEALQQAVEAIGQAS